MTREFAENIVKDVFDGIITDCREEVPGVSWKFSLRPGKYLVRELQTSVVSVRIVEVNFETKELTVLVSEE